MYLVCTASEPSFTGFLGVQHDANMQVPDAQQPAQDNDRDHGDPCPEGDQDFDRLDAATMEEAISCFDTLLRAQSFQNCNRRLWISWICYSNTCQTRQARRESGILRRLTAFYTRSVRLLCGATQITPLVKLQRYKHGTY